MTEERALRLLGHGDDDLAVLDQLHEARAAEVTSLWRLAAV